MSNPEQHTISTQGTVRTLLSESDRAEAPPSVDELVPHVLGELRSIARAQLRRERSDVALQTTELLHEAYLRLVGDGGVSRRGRAYFFAAAARAMRQVLVDAARRRGTAKRGGDVALVTLGTADAPIETFASELQDLEEALDELAQRNERHARVVECRYFGGMTVEETALALGVSPRTVKTDWALARAWLAERLASGHVS